MIQFSLIIDSVLKGKNNFCCLCLHTIENSSDQENVTENHVTVDINDKTRTISVSDLIQTVLGDEIEDYTSTFDNICSQCLETLIDTYKFKQKSIENSLILTKTLETLSNTVQSLSNSEDTKSLYITLDANNFMWQPYYGTKQEQSAKSALKSLNILQTSKNILESKPPLKEPLVKARKVRKKIKTNIKIIDLLHDPNNSEMRCKDCLRTYPSKYCLKNHYLRVHAPKIFHCSKCPSKFGTKQLLEAHEVENHVQLSCRTCNKQYNSRKSLKSHELAHNLIICTDCGRKYRNKTTFRKHIELNVCKQECRANPVNAKYTCDYCQKRYTQKVSLRVHIQFEHLNYKAHLCKWCGKKFWAESRLKAHTVKHTRERNFICGVCSNKFVSKEALLYHTRLHTGERPYKCTECDQRFLSSSRRTDHMKRCHSCLVSCNKCNVRFSSYVKLDEHKRNHEFEDSLMSDMSLDLRNNCDDAYLIAI